VRDALAFGPIGPQLPGGTLSLEAQKFTQSEDCLTLNVWTGHDVGAGRPMMVWIHGGAFRGGSSASPMYDGAALAARGDVVVVTINYRLGALGFLAHPDLRDGDGPAANWGLLDQLAALRWVRANAEAFGGDPANVTVFGESAGAASIGLLLASPLSDGLFHKAILQSGSATAGKLEVAAPFAERAAEILGVGDVAALRAVAVDDLMRTQAELERGGLIVFAPVIDGHFLTRRPISAVADGSAAGVATIVGTNRDEWKLWAPADPHSRDLNEEGLRKRLIARLEGGVDDVINLFRKEREARGESTAPNDLWFAIETERFFRVSSIRLADALTNHEPGAWVYLFTWGSPAMKGWLGACHAVEIAFVFGTHGGERALFTGAGPAADALSERMMDHWLAFARTGDPSTPEQPWPRYDARRRSTLVIGEEDRVEDAPMDAERRVVDDHLSSEGAIRIGAVRI
jgi:para-nitrobenzyl esterase